MVNLKETSSSALATDKENFAGDKYPSASLEVVPPDSLSKAQTLNGAQTADYVGKNLQCTPRQKPVKRRKILLIF